MKKLFLTIMFVPIILFFVVAFPFSSALGEDVAFSIKKGDALYEQRANLEKCNESIGFYKKALEIAPNNYEANWKVCRAIAYMGYAAPTEATDVKEKYGKMAMPYGEKAFGIKPDKVEGHYYYVYALANYAKGCGIFAAISKGLGGKMETQSAIATNLDKPYDRMGIMRLVGEYYDGEEALAIKEAELAISTKPNYVDEPEADIWKEEAKTLLKEMKGR